MLTYCGGAGGGIRLPLCLLDADGPSEMSLEAPNSLPCRLLLSLSSAKLSSSIPGSGPLDVIGNDDDGNGSSEKAEGTHAAGALARGGVVLPWPSWEMPSGSSARRRAARCCASRTSPCMKRHLGPYGHRPVRANERHALVLYDEGWSYDQERAGKTVCGRL